MINPSHRYRSACFSICFIWVLLVLIYQSTSFASGSLTADTPAAITHDTAQQGSLQFTDDETVRTPTEYAPSIDSEEVDSGSGILRMVVSLLVVLALIAVSIFFLKKITPYSGIIGSNVQSKHPMVVLSRLSLGQRRFICLVRIVDEILVIGVTNTSMSLLSKISTEDYYSEDTGVHRTPGNANSQSTRYGGNFRSFRKVLEKIGVWDREPSDSP